MHKASNLEAEDSNTRSTTQQPTQSNSTPNPLKQPKQAHHPTSHLDQQPTTEHPPTANPANDTTHTHNQTNLRLQICHVLLVRCPCACLSHKVVLSRGHHELKARPLRLQQLLRLLRERREGKRMGGYGNRRENGWVGMEKRRERPSIYDSLTSSRKGGRGTGAKGSLSNG